MSWVKLATAFPRHPKAIAAGASGRHLWFVSLCWSGEYNTDGKVPGHMLPALAFDAGLTIDEAQEAADRLVTVGLWDRGPDCWTFHDWSDWQTTAEERDERQRRERERKAEWRKRKDELSHGTDVGRTRLSPLTEAEAEAEAEALLKIPLPPHENSGADWDEERGDPPAPHQMSSRANRTNPRAQGTNPRARQTKQCLTCGGERHPVGPCPLLLEPADRMGYAT